MTNKKIQCISDTHGRKWTTQIKKCDILLHCGDISPVDMPHDYLTQKQWFYDVFLDELNSLKDRVGNVVFIAGNHDAFLYSDFCLNKDTSEFNDALPDHVHYLADEEITIDGVRIYGTPWCSLPKWANLDNPVWNFSQPDEDLKQIYDTIPEGLDVLITHGPAHTFCDQILDETLMEKKKRKRPDESTFLGSKSLIQKINNLKNKPKYVLSGHIHSAEHSGKHLPQSDVEFRCVSYLNESYLPEYDPFTFEMKK